MSTSGTITVVLPCRNQRHLLWRSLASVAEQTRQPDRVIVLDRGSTDGIGDWLLARWPGVELCAADADPTDAAARLGDAVSAERLAVLRPGEHWRPSHLAELGDADGWPELSAAMAADDPKATQGDGVEALDVALASLPEAAEAVLVDLRAAARPLDLIGMLGLALRGEARGRSLRAMTLAELTWPTLASAAAGAPLLINFGGTLGLEHGSDQLCIEQLIGASRDRPVRVLVHGLCPTTPAMFSRLLDAVAGHTDLELWIGDAVSCRFARSVLDPRRIRLVPPAILGLTDPLRRLNEHPAIDPGMLGSAAGPLDLALRARDHASWWRGYEPEPARRLGLVLAGMVEIRRAVVGPLLQRAWLSTLVGWAAVRASDGEIRTSEPLLAMFARMCGVPATQLAANDPKTADLGRTWPSPAPVRAAARRPK